MKGEAAPDFRILREALDEIRTALAEEDLDAWLLYDLHARNPVAGRMLGLGDQTRRFFVLVPREGEPHALIHGIEQTPWRQWPWQSTVYVGWAPLREQLESLVAGRRVAMEYSANDAVPAMDIVPALEWEKRVLKLLQWKNPRKRWVLKDPMHLDRIPALLQATIDRATGLITLTNGGGVSATSLAASPLP